MTKKELDQLDDLVKNARWKVLFSDNFRKSLEKLKGSHRKLVLNLLLKLSGGWRPKNKSVDLYCEKSSHVLKQFKVEGLYVICTVDIIKELQYIQVLKVWDVLSFEEIPKVAQRLDNMFAVYTDDYIRRCSTKHFEGNLEIPKSWPVSQEVIRFRCLSNDECKIKGSEKSSDGGNSVENLKVSESLLLMKFYSLTSGVVNHLLSGKEVELPMQVTDEQMDIILFPKSSFVIGRSGTGKTTILTMKLFRNEQSFHVASEGVYEVETSDSEVVDDLQDSKPSILRQLFVTVSPKLCYAVKKHISRLITCNGNSSADSIHDDADLTSEYDDIPNNFSNIPVKSYPLVITFHKFIMMVDATLGNSFFERFLETREGVYGNHLSSRSVAVQTFIRSKEVTLYRFCSLYWPHFDLNLTKRLDPSRVFTEIISHIKGGLQAGESLDGKLSFEDYSLLAESRASTLTKQKREIVDTLFEVYEKMKTKRGEFDLSDLVNDIHHRLVNGSYEGDQMDFFYIDEVQDLSMRQISLFKYICQNVKEGFMFAGDTAQTIGRGIDFRFQDIRSLFYKEFGKEEKDIVSEIFQLKQNFRTHAGVLELSQSIIDILYRYFVHSIDKLDPEVSYISGEAPVLLESGSDENVIATIFGGSGSGGEMVGFGAEQVILVRDDSAKTEISQYVGKHALVLTIVECKGLEFQDVLLYNFFGTSPLKGQWRVIYGYMKEQDCLDEKLPQSFPTFSESRHTVLCSELKQLYVAITRTRQRLWICENKDDLSKPMFDFWKTRALVQIRKLDDSVAQAMRVASTPEEWRERGKKLFYENNFGMATMCFERAGDIMWEKLAKASGLRASADQMRETNYEAFLGYLREAAGIFESIGKLESAASCYCDLGEYERAEKFYTSGKTDEAATECFTVAGHDSKDAEAYTKVDRLSDCLSACREGKPCEKGLQYIQYRKDVNDQSTEIEQIDDLLVLEEESGRFLDAAELARSTGDVLKEADLLGKAGYYKEATILLVWHVFFSSLWGNGNKGWPLKQFAQKEEVCEKAKSLAEMESDIFFDFVCSELKIFSEESSSLLEQNKDLHASQEIKSLRGEILSIRKILDSHVHLDSSEYDWEDEIPTDINKHCDEKTYQNRVSVRTLAFYWNLWKENVVDIFESLEIFLNEEPHKHEDHVKFSLNYFGVRKYGNMVYSLVNKDADWVRNNGQTGLHNDGNLVTIDRVQLVFAMRSYWQSELLSVGIKVLETLDALHKSKSNGSAFHQSTSLLHIFEVSKFLLDFQYLNLSNPYTKKLQRFLEIALTYFDLVFPLDWRKSETGDLISLRRTDLSVNLLDEIILQNVYSKGNFTYWTIGRVMMVICLDSRKSVDFYEHIINKIQNPVWKYAVEQLRDVGFNDIYAIIAFQNALYDTLLARWNCCAGCISPHGCCISPHSFVYLLDRVLFISSLYTGSFYAAKSSFAEWFTHHDSTENPNITEPKKICSKLIVNSFVKIIGGIFFNRFDTELWTQTSTINHSYYYPIFALKLVKIMSLIVLEQEKDQSEILIDSLSGLTSIARLLPKKFVFHLLKRKEGRKLNLNADMVAEAFMSIDDPLLIVSSGDSSPRIHAPCAIFVDLTKSKEEITSLLFSNKNNTNSGQTCSNNVDVGTICDLPSSSNLLPSDTEVNVNPGDGYKGGMKMNWKIIKKVFDIIRGEDGVSLSLLSDPNADTIKKELDRNMHILSTAHSHEKPRARKITILVREAFNDLSMLSNVFDESHHNEEQSLFMMVQENVESLLSIKPKIDKFLKHSVMSRELKAGKMVVVSHCSSSSSSTTKIEETSDGNTQDEKNKKEKGNSKGKNRKSKGKKK